MTGLEPTPATNGEQPGTAVTLADLHVIPDRDTTTHLETPDCPCRPRPLPARGRTMWAHQREGEPRGEPGGIRFRREPPDPMEEALVEWLRCAELRKNGQVTHTAVNVVGHKVYARHYAKTIADHIKANGPNLAELTYHLQHPLRGGRKVRAYTFAGHIAEGAIEELHRKGLL
jgi:hypothetical protein